MLYNSRSSMEPIVFISSVKVRFKLFKNLIESLITWKSEKPSRLPIISTPPCVNSLYLFFWGFSYLNICPKYEYWFVNSFWFWAWYLTILDVPSGLKTKVLPPLSLNWYICLDTISEFSPIDFSNSSLCSKWGVWMYE